MPTTADIKSAREIKSMARLREQLCGEARYPVDYKGRRTVYDHMGRRRWKLELTACVECESPCGYGMEVLRRIPIHDLLELGCGGDCMTCPEPCRLCEIVRQKIMADEAEKAVRDRRAQEFVRQAFALARPPRA